MGSSLQIRDVPEPTRRALEARAAERGQSLDAYLLDLIDREASQPTAGEVLDRAARRAERSTVSSAELIRALRDEREEELLSRLERRSSSASHRLP